MKAAHDRIIVKIDNPQIETSAGILIPELKPEGIREAIVIAAGPGRLLDTGTIAPLSVKNGDRILIGQYAGSEWQNEEGTYFTIREEDVLAIVDS